MINVTREFYKKPLKKNIYIALGLLETVASIANYIMVLFSP